MINNIIEEFIKIHGNKYDYSLVNFLSLYDKVMFKCNKHGIFKQIPYSHLKGKGCPKCGVEKRTNILQSNLEEFIEKAKIVHGDKYNYSFSVYKGAKNKITIRCPIHGDFEQMPSKHLMGHGCPHCYYIKVGNFFRLTQEEFIERAIKIHYNKYDYSKVIYKHSQEKIIITCFIHGDFEQTPYSHLQGQGCPKCKASKGEIAIKTILDKYNITCTQEYKIPQIEKKYEYDFYLPNYNLLIEFHGKQHYEFIPYFHKDKEGFKYQLIRDDKKRELAKAWGYRYLEIHYSLFENLSEEEFEKRLLRNIK